MRLRETILITFAAGFLLIGCKTTYNPSNESHMQASCDIINFRATVVSIEYLDEFDGSVYVTHFDPRFVLTLNIKSINPMSCQIEVGQKAFAIHSPSHVFSYCSNTGSSDSVLQPQLWGKSFDFTTEYNENKWSSLTAMDIDSK